MRRTTARAQRAAVRSALLATTLVFASSCAARAPLAGPPEPALAEELRRRSEPDRHLHIIFDWTAIGRDDRFEGRGALRLAPGYRARLDLFGPRGDGLLSAVLLDDRMAVADDGNAALLPPPALLWSVLGIFRPPADAALTGTARTAAGSMLEYGADRSRWRFHFASDRLVQVEWDAGSSRRTVAIGGYHVLGVPTAARYRDHADFRELSLTLIEVHEVAPFDPEIWRVSGRP